MLVSSSLEREGDCYNSMPHRGWVEEDRLADARPNQPWKTPSKTLYSITFPVLLEIHDYIVTPNPYTWKSINGRSWRS